MEKSLLDELRDASRTSNTRKNIENWCRIETDEYGKKGIYTSEVYRLNFGGNIIDLTDLEQLVELSQTKALGFALDYACQYMDKKNTLKDIITQVMDDIEQHGLDILGERISGNFAWFRGLELAFVLNRLRSVAMNQKSISKQL